MAEDVDLLHGGAMPLPPIKRSAATDRVSSEEDEARYQTVFARCDGSLAAPTAGLHFTPEILGRFLMSSLPSMSAQQLSSVKTEDVTQHQMHPSDSRLRRRQPRLSQRQSDCCRRNNNGASPRIGSTQNRNIQPIESETDIFIYPPFQFRIVDVLLTLHLPRSTLLMLVSAFAGRNLFCALTKAVRERYRFFSYGDCMLIL